MPPGVSDKAKANARTTNWCWSPVAPTSKRWLFFFFFLPRLHNNNGPAAALEQLLSSWNHYNLIRKVSSKHRALESNQIKVWKQTWLKCYLTFLWEFLPSSGDSSPFSTTEEKTDRAGSTSLSFLSLLRREERFSPFEIHQICDCVHYAWVSFSLFSAGGFNRLSESSKDKVRRGHISLEGNWICIASSKKGILGIPYRRTTIAHLPLHTSSPPPFIPPILSYLLPPCD